MARAIQQITPDALSRPQSDSGRDATGRSSTMGEKAMDRLFTRLGAEFGNKFISTIPTAEAENASKAIWAERLDGLSLDEVRQGVDKLADYAKRNNGWPPGAAEFHALCKPRREPYERVEFQQRALTQSLAHKTVAQSHIDALRNRITQPEVES